ncbi:hypothetical protein JCM10450v2_007331 [Rhodotorula kratochvilovae]
MSTAHQRALANMPVSTAGISASPSGERVVAASLRPDGSVRKERKVRPGFTPAEDIARYRPPASRAAGSGGRGRGVPGLGAAVQAALGLPTGRGRGAPSGQDRRPPGAQSTPRAAAVASWKTAPAPAASEAKGKAKEVLPPPTKADQLRESWDASSSEEEGSSGAPKDEKALPPPVPTVVPQSAPEPPALTPEEAEKRARALRKKLRQAEQLSSRPALTPAEQEKVDGIAGLEAELAALSV